MLNLICTRCGNTFQAKPAKNYVKRFCSNRCQALGRNTTHGGTETREYISWQEMRWRCNRPTHHAYARYGGRGIKVCERWLDFANFLADMGPRPDRQSIERIDNDGNYEPTNCRWATRTEQSRNRAMCMPAEHQKAIRDGIDKHLSFNEIAQSIGRSYGSVSNWAYRVGLKSGYEQNKPKA